MIKVNKHLTLNNTSEVFSNQSNKIESNQIKLAIRIEPKSSKISHFTFHHKREKANEIFSNKMNTKYS